ncbi:tRNA threonylcarbamoyladenosine biosynthesis protein TsaE [hydrothermal vent metagenome]|uniref:tRNA threonylcarbamoyladenosine biosynthesis protein TsaE n=1 Tax=hydrothermal vent metagenome TaxID=652676 RepID=A0A3B1CL13_9ZZZZ
MTKETVSTVTTTSPDETRGEGEKLGRTLKSGDIVLLDGELGVGKTVFTQGIARGLNVDGSTPVRSPTYTIIHEYKGPVPVRHADLYRIDSIDDLETVGLFDAGYDGVTVIEWAGKLKIEAGCVEVELKEISETGREITITDRRKK